MLSSLAEVVGASEAALRLLISVLVGKLNQFKEVL